MIREYRPSDNTDILLTWEAASAVAHPFLSEAFLEQERHNIPNVYLPNAETWVWQTEPTPEQGGPARVVGFIAMLGNEIGAIFVDPAYQRSGIGRALLAHVRELHGTLQVEVFTKNALGRAFYDRSGFELLEYKLHEPTGFELMRLRLAPV